MSKREEQRAQTRARLIEVARRLFVERGYSAVGTEEIVQTAGVTRGALYHHFDGKLELFAAVHEQLEEELIETIAARMMTATDPLEALRTGIAVFLDACRDPEMVQIVIVDAPTALGWVRWREIEERYGLGLVQSGLEMAMDAGQLRRQPVGPLAHLLLAALTEAALIIGNAAAPAQARQEVEAVLLGLLDGLRG